MCMLKKELAGHHQSMTKSELTDLYSQMSRTSLYKIVIHKSLVIKSFVYAT